MAVRFQLRRDTAANWAVSNPVLALGEPGVETDTLKVKVGDGSTAWNSLAYSITKDFTQLTNKPTTVAGYGITDALTLTALSVTQNAASGLGALSYNNSTGVFSYTPPDLTALGGDVIGSVFADDSTVMVDGVNAVLNFVNNTTTDLTEGTNLYYTNARADARIAAASITDLSDANQTVRTTDNVTFNSVTGNVFTSLIDSSDSSAITITPDVVMSAGLTVGNHIIPSSNLNIDLGSATNRFRELFLSGNTISLDSLKLSSASGALLVHDGAGSRSNIQSHNIDANDIAAAGNVTVGGNLTMTGYIAGPATFTIDPAAVGDNTGTVVIAGNLQVDGTTTTINSTTVNVDDLNIQLATGAINAAAANGAGITVDGANATITYDGTNDAWHVNKSFGIGTNAPGLTLDVATSGGAAGQFNRHLLLSRGTSVGGSLGTIRASANNDVSVLVMGVDTDQTLAITDTGRVGVGTIDPGRLFTVSGTGGVLVSIVSTDDDNCQLMFGDSASDTIGKVIYRHADDRLTLQAGGTETVHVVGGKVGIGYNNPQNQLHVLGSSGTPSVGITLQTHDTANATATLSLLARDASNVNQTVNIQNNKGELYIDSNVGIGESDPAGKLEVQKSATNYAILGTSTSGHYFESQSDDGTDGFEIYQQHGRTTTRNSFIVNDNRTGSKSAAFTIRGDGHAAVGGTNFTGRLSVAPGDSTTDAAMRSIYSGAKLPAVTTNETNYWHNLWIQHQDYDIAAGVTDSGYRIGLNIEGYHDTNDLAGTLATQKNIWSRAGNNSGGTGTITNLYNLHLETLSGGGMTITNNWGLYQSGSGTKNYLEGNTGIGIDPGIQKLHVNGTTAVGTAGSGTTGGSAGLSIATAGGTSCPLYFGTETDSAQKSMYMLGYWIYLRGHQNEGIRFLFSQGAGTAPRSDQYEFKYNSATRPTGSTTWDGFSDIRAKENIRDMTGALDTVNQLRPVRYDWTDVYADTMNMWNMDTTDEKSYKWTSTKLNGYDTLRKNDQYGFIAQEFETVFPKDVKENKMTLATGEVIEDFKTVNYDSLIPVLTKAVQELSAQVEALQAEINQLKGQ